jgi:hypothetical protein
MLYKDAANCMSSSFSITLHHWVIL